MNLRSTTTMKAHVNLATGALVAAIVTLAGCTQTTAIVLTQAPPGRSATIDEAGNSLALSVGVALALECTEFADDYSGPCRDFAASADDAAPLTILPAHLDALPGQSAYRGASTVVTPDTRTGVVVFGAAAGTTALTLSSRTGQVLLDVTVAEPVPAE